jgi:hypothetical protein
MVKGPDGTVKPEVIALVIVIAGALLGWLSR